MKAANSDVFALKYLGLNAFLYADVGAELNGSPLTILSVLAGLARIPGRRLGCAAMPTAAAIEDSWDACSDAPCTAAPAFAADPAAIANPPAANETASAIKRAEKCLADLRAFDSQMQKDGFWLSGSGYGYGCPMMGGYGFDHGYPLSSGAMPTRTGYRDVRPGYDVRTLMAAANILARSGQQQAREDLLATSQNTYKSYVADLKSGKTSTSAEPDWQQRQVAAATPVTAKDTSFRSDQLIGTEVRNPQNEALGSVDDIVMSPQTGKIAYLVIARGGIFGIDEKYVPVPWEDFKATPNASLLVLDTTKSVMEASPQVSHEQFATPGQFDQERQKVDAYWKANLSAKTAGKTNG